MDFEKIGEGEYIEIIKKNELNNNNEIDKEKLMFSRIIKSVGADIAIIEIPYNHNGSLLLIEGEILKLFNTYQGKMYCFEIEVNKRVKAMEQGAYVILKKTDAQMIQRRNYYRLPVKFDLDIKVSDSTFNGSGNLKVISKDVSASGIAFESKEFIEEGKKIIISIDINKIVNLECEVVRVAKNEMSAKYIVACKYISINREDREKLVKFIFEEERSLIKIQSRFK